MEFCVTYRSQLHPSSSLTTRFSSSFICLINFEKNKCCSAPGYRPFFCALKKVVRAFSGRGFLKADLAKAHFGWDRPGGLTSRLSL
jgi:hypothetical protein